MFWLSVLPVAVLAAVPFALTAPLSPRWDDMRVKHVWGSIPEKWECQGHPALGTTMDLRIALKPHRENALIDVLHEVSNPNHSKYVSIPAIVSPPAFTHTFMCICYHCYVADTVRTCPRSKLPGLSLLIRTHSN
jgi:hypothetical protein